jgi:arylformamidase
MTIYDISVTISPSLPIFPGDPRVGIDPVCRIAKGDQANVSRISLSSHTGSHIDAPRHFDDRGLSLEDIPLSRLLGPSLVVDLRGVSVIDRQTLAALPLEGVERLLFRTDNSSLWSGKGFNENYVHLCSDGAELLAAKGVKLVGIDYLSIEKFDGNGAVHRLLLGNSIIILEGLNLDGIEAGEYELLCLPLKIEAGDGAPVRAVLRR